MKYATEISCSILLVIILAKICTVLIKGVEARKLKRIQTLNALYKSALDYFVTVCSKQLTYFGKEKPSCKYLSFLFYSDEFYLFSNEHDSNKKLILKTILHVKFDGYALVDQLIPKTYTFVTFEKHLSVLCRNGCVYDRYVENLEWVKNNNPDFYKTLPKPVT